MPSNNGMHLTNGHGSAQPSAGDAGRSLAGTIGMRRPLIIGLILLGHLGLAWLTLQALNLVEEHSSLEGPGFLAVLGATVPLSFFFSLLVVGGFPLQWALWRRALLATFLLSPLSLTLWLTIYINIVGYRG